MKPQEKEPELNEHHKQEYAPSHTAEHLLNQTMVRMFGCERSENAHVERKKSKISFLLPECPSDESVEEIVRRMNELIEADLPVSYEYTTIGNLPPTVNPKRLPKNVSQTIRLVKIGDYDCCPCIGEHVAHTAQIGKFILLGTNWDAEKHSFRIRFKTDSDY